MDALIIAAGYGSRLADISPSKPLTPIAGVPLIELGLRNAKAAGAGKVVVVTGHAADRIDRSCLPCPPAWASLSRPHAPTTGPSPTAGP
jgi:NDP-sugar pyrophosphorylase family protein